MPPRCVIFRVNHIRYVLSPRCKRSVLFHTGAAWRSDTGDHYEVLGVDSTASASDIKKQFYSLSKVHHPDHNSTDPEASARFVKISEAYAILGSPQKRERYDRENRRASDGPRANESRGSHSSSAPHGSRPASGLSRRRTQFRGPPPSFYRSGGWGTQGAKRRAQAEAAAPGAADMAAGTARAGPSTTSGGGFRPGGAPMGWDNDVPHFDRNAHYRTQEQQDERRRRRLEEDAVYNGGGGSVWLNFFLLSGVVALAGSLPLIFRPGAHEGKRDAG